MVSPWKQGHAEIQVNLLSAGKEPIMIVANNLVAET